MRVLNRAQHVFLIAVALACGRDNPRILNATRPVVPAQSQPSLTELDKIHALIDAVRRCDCTIRSGPDHVRDGPQAAAELERRVASQAKSVPTAQDFIERIAAASSPQAPLDTVHTSAHDGLPLRAFLREELARLEERDVTQPSPRAKAPVGEPTILEALTVVERSGLTFVAPARVSRHGRKRGHKPGKDKTYGAPEFATMLRKKWQFFGADIVDWPTFRQEIATRAFSSMMAYDVVHADGNREPFAPWLEAQLQAHRHPAAAHAPSASGSE